MNQADTVFAIADLQDRIEDIERAYRTLLPRNEWNLTEYEQILGWRMCMVARGADPKKILHQFPPEQRARPEPYEPPKFTSVMDA